MNFNANSVRCVQRRFVSDQASASTNIPVFLPVLGSISLALVVYLVSIAVVRYITNNRASLA